jgi:hypothetical protein
LGNLLIAVEWSNWNIKVHARGAGDFGIGIKPQTIQQGLQSKSQLLNGSKLHVVGIQIKDDPVGTVDREII